MLPFRRLYAYMPWTSSRRVLHKFVDAFRARFIVSYLMSRLFCKGLFARVRGMRLADKYLHGPDGDRRRLLAAPDRRSGNRHRSVCRIARVSRATDIGLWLVRNISDKGMMLQTSVDVGGGEDVEIALSEDTVVSGRIVWAGDGLCGIVFSEPIDVEETLADLARQQQSEGYRALRLPVDAEAMLITASDAFPIDLVDISKNGAGFRCRTLLEPGQLINLVLPGDGERRSALVRWVADGRGGLWFTSPLPRQTLESVERFRPKT